MASLVRRTTTLFVALGLIAMSMVAFASQSRAADKTKTLTHAHHRWSESGRHVPLPSPRPILHELFVPYLPPQIFGFDEKKLKAQAENDIAQFLMTHKKIIFFSIEHHHKAPTVYPPLSLEGPLLIYTERDD